MLTSELKSGSPQPRRVPVSANGGQRERDGTRPAAAAPLPPALPVRRRGIGTRLRDGLSLAIWVLTTAGAALGRQLQSLARAWASWLPAGGNETRPEPAQFTEAGPPAPRTRASVPTRTGTARPPRHPADRSLPPATPPKPPRSPRPRPRARPAVVVGAVLTAFAVLALFSAPVLRLAAWPLSSRLSSKGLPLLDQRSAVLAADGSTLAVVHDGINRKPIPLDEIPEILRQAVVAAEDKEFWSHSGYDGEAVARALIANLRARGVTQGGSTISQQVAKQNFVGGDQTFLRKAKELLYAVALEKWLSKEQLLERYLNQVYFGSQAYGVAAAADEFFGVDVKDLTVEQSALLAGLVRAPAALDPRTDPESATARRNQVLRAMAAMGAIPSDVAAEAAAKPIVVLPARSAVVTEPFVVEAVKREFLDNPAFGETEADRRQLLLAGGLEIRTTVDPRLQDAARTALSYVSDDLGSALVALDPRSGAILAVHDGGQAGAIHFDVATQGQRGPGSTFKPLAAAAALEAGMPQNQYLVGDGPIELDYRGAPEPWPVDNFDGIQHGPVALAEAVIKSVNTAFAQLGVAVGSEKIADVARRLGIDVDRAMGPPHKRGPAVALGGLSNGVSPLELASAYGTFAAGGVHARPYIIAQVLGPDGQELYKAEPAPQPALDSAVNGILVDILQEAVAEGTGSAASLPGWEPLGKTGTSEEGADAWFVGATPVLSAAVWVGHPGSSEPVPGLTGGRVGAPVWREFMTAALRGVAPVTFPPRTSDRPATRPLDLPVVRPCTTCEDKSKTLPVS